MIRQHPLLRLKPGVGKRWLLLAAGLVWCAVGVLLCSYAFDWFTLAEPRMLLLLFASALLIGLAFFAAIFARFSKRNISRIEAYPQDKVCIFAFQRWSSYPLVVLMISLGIFLRRYSSIPKPYLAPLYFGIGSALFVAGARYLQVLLFHLRSGNLPAS